MFYYSLPPPHSSSCNFFLGPNAHMRAVRWPHRTFRRASRIAHEEKEMKVSFSEGVKKTWPSFLPPPQVVGTQMLRWILFPLRPPSGFLYLAKDPGTQV